MRLNIPRWVLVRAAMVACAALGSAMAGADSAVDIGNRWEPLADRFLVERLDGSARHELIPPEYAGPVFAFDAPWEGRYCGYVTVLQDGGRFLMYYRGLPESGNDGSAAEVTCIAESSDGIAWQRPALNLFTVNGISSNNVVLADKAPYSHNFAPFLDTNPECPPERRFKALAGILETGLSTFVSPDGTHWTMETEGAIREGGVFDSQNVAFWSETEKQYLCYARTWSTVGFSGFRWIGRSTSPDFQSWTPVVPMEKGDAPDEHIYTNQTLPCPDAPHLYISIAARFMPNRRAITEEEAARIGVEPKYAGDCSDVILMTSRGGNRYERSFLEAYIRPGIGPEHWTSRTNYPARGIIKTGPEEWSIYIQEAYGQPAHRLVRYRLGPMRFAAVRAGHAGGVLETRPFIFTGETLYLNMSTSAAGHIRCALLDAETGKPLPGFDISDCPEIIGNDPARAVRWTGGSLAPLSGKPVRLRVDLRDADLYALRFGPAEDKDR